MRRLLPLCLVLAPSPLMAQEEPICADRPGLGSPPCATPAGRVVAELGLADWTLDRMPGERSDTIVAGDLLVRIGLADGLEAQVGWTSFGTLREREDGAVSRQSSIGDARFGMLKTIVEGDPVEVSALARVSVPIGGEAIGAGDWGVSLLAPTEIALGGPFSFELTPSIAASVDEDRSGRHLAYGSIFGIGADLSDTALASIEIGVTEDDDPHGASTPVLLGMSAGWRPNPNFQIDCGANVGLNEDADDLELYVGISRRF
ncbi:transporter [Sphingomonas sp. Y38-1Y]|uniref:transporter n=1 Tax=Sphingomonas sp. Y38-1Y TaxID=3078265 RepID=UPI0028E31C6A|nr:transporter [Sphingomonas sp. Y38-1Y]